MTPALEVIVVRSFGFVAAIISYGAMASPLGHRFLIASSSLICAAALMWASLLFESGNSLIMVASVIVLIASNVFYVALMAFCTESFPTVGRALSVGLAITVGRVGAIGTPLLAEAVGEKEFLRTAAYVSCVASLLMVPLRETKGLPLDDFLDEPLALQAKSQTDYGSTGNDLEANSASSSSDAEDEKA